MITGNLSNPQKELNRKMEAINEVLRKLAHVAYFAMRDSINKAVGDSSEQIRKILTERKTDET